MMFLLLLSVLYRVWTLLVSVISWPFRKHHLVHRNGRYQRRTR